MELGVAFTPFETRTDTIVRLSSRADVLGLARVDVAEAWTHDALVLLTELALRTSYVGLGSCVLSTWGRTPATLALGAAGLQRCSHGRFMLGLGAGSPPLTEGLHGIEWDRPVAKLRRTLTDVRALLDGERLPHPAAGARPLKLGEPPATPVPIALAALSDASIRLAGELADVWTPFLWARSRLDEGRALLGGSRTKVAVGLPVALAPDQRRARGLAAWWLHTYATRMGPLYPRMLARRFGFAEAVEAVAPGAAELPREAEALAREVTLIGTYDRAAEEIRAWFDAGADSVSLVLPPGRPEAELAELVDVAASVIPRADPAAA